jgi:hypothetical protein
MSLAITISSVDSDQNSFYARGKLTASGSYSTGGDTLDFSGQGSIPAAQPPIQVWVGGSTGDAYAWIAGSALNSGKVKINTAAGTELAAGAYPARITGDTNIQFEAVFSKLL